MIADNERMDLEEKYKNKIITNEKIIRKNVSFQANKKEPLYRLFKYKEGFSKDIVNICIDHSGKEKGVILDPFMGIGTTGFVAQERGFDAIGIELLPVGNFVIEAKKALLNMEYERIKKYFKEVQEVEFESMRVDDTYSFKHIPITNKAFPSDTEYKINSYLTYVENEIDDLNIKKILKYVLISVLESISFTRKDGQYLRWDKRSGKTKGKFDKGRIYSFEEALMAKMEELLEDKMSSTITVNGEFSQISGSSLEKLHEIPPNSVDLVISSPPYCNRYDYTRTYALEMVFLGVDNDRIKDFRQKMLSCTVENRSKVEELKEYYTSNNRLDEFNIIKKVHDNCKALDEVNNSLEELKEQGELNNKNISNMVRNYFFEHAFIVYEMTRVLNKGGRIYYVNDNVRYAGEIIPVDLILSEFAEGFGLNVENIIKLDKGKGNSSQQMGAHGREEVRKCVYIWTKEKGQSGNKEI